MVEIVERDVFNDKDICKRCHRKLKDDKSKELGFGPVCYKKYLNRKKTYLFDMEVNNEITIK